MTRIEATIPDDLAEQTLAAAARAKVSVDLIVSHALAAQLAVLQGGDDITVRAARADRTALARILDRVPDVEPPDYDRID